MNTDQPTLIPASNFRVRKLGSETCDGVRVKVSRYAYFLRAGWGLWDVAAQAWVAGEETVEGQTVVAPWAFARKSVAQRAVKDGLYLGYHLYTDPIAHQGHLNPPESLTMGHPAPYNVEVRAADPPTAFRSMSAQTVDSVSTETNLHPLGVLGKASRGGTSLSGYCITTFAALVALMGEPHFGDQTADAEWAFRCQDGTVFTVYAWNELRTPMGQYRWHIGGKGNALAAFQRFTGLPTFSA